MLFQRDSLCRNFSVLKSSLLCITNTIKLNSSITLLDTDLILTWRKFRICGVAYFSCVFTMSVAAFTTWPAVIIYITKERLLVSSQYLSYIFSRINCTCMKNMTHILSGDQGPPNKILHHGLNLSV